MKPSIALAMLAAVSAFSAPAYAESEHGRFQATLTLVASCSIEKIPPANTGSLSTDISCSKGNSYGIGLSNTKGTRTVKSAHGTTPQYQTYPPSTHSLSWDNQSVLSGTGTGAIVSHGVRQAGAPRQKTAGETLTITLTF